jgi:hypothetical protein
MRPRARLRAPNGDVVDLGHGDLVGRLWSAALVVDDPRVSEAHALVSLRGDALKLLALRGRFAVDGRPVTEVALAAGQRIELARDVVLQVVDVEVPDEVLGIEADGLPRQVLPGTCALVAGPPPAIAPPSDARAVAHAWSGPSGWRVQPVGGDAVDLAPGTVVEAGGVWWRAVAVRLSPRSEPTRSPGGVHDPLRLVARYDTVHVFRPRAPVAVLDGLGARIVSELVALDGPVAWTTLAELLWPGHADRRKLDAVLARLRRRLAELNVRTDLVRANGCGQIELVLHEGDVAEDRA